MEQVALEAGVNPLERPGEALEAPERVVKL